MLRLAFQTLRTRRALFAGSLAAVTLALMLLTASGVLLDSALRGEGEANRFDAASLVVTGDRDEGLDGKDHSPGFGDVEAPLVPRPPVDGDLVERVEKVDGVRDVIPDLAFSAQVVADDGRPVTPELGERSLGHAWQSARVTPYQLRDGSPPKGSRDVVVDAAAAARGRIHVGDRVKVFTAVEGHGTYRVSGIAGPPGTGLTKDQVALFFTAATAAQLAPPGGDVHAVAVTTAPGEDLEAVASRVRDAVGHGPGVRVLTDTARAEISASDVLFLDTLVFVVSMGSLAVFVALFVMASGFAFAVLQRHREIALLRVIGATPRQVKRMLGWETLCVAVLGAAVAVPVGAALARPLARGLVGLGIAPDELTVRITWLPLAGAAAVGILITRLAVVSAARRAARVRPDEALREAELADRGLPLSRLLTGLAFLLFTGCFLFFGIAMGGVQGAGLAFGGVLTLLIASAVLGPALVRPLVPLAGALLRVVFRRTGHLALANSATAPRRVAAAAVPLILMIGFPVSALFMQTSQQSTAKEWAADRLVADHVLVPRDATGLPPAVARDAARLPGVASVSATSSAWVRVSVRTDEAESVNARALAADPKLPEALRLHVREGGLTGLVSGSAVAVSQEQAKEYGWRVGDRVRLRLPDGTRTTLRVGARYDRSLGFADLIVPSRVLRAHTPDPLLDAVYVKRAPGTRQAALDEELAGLTRTWPMAGTADRDQVRDAGTEDAASQTWPAYVFSALIAAFTALALANTLVMATLVRAGEFAVLRLAGATRRDVLALVAGESSVVAACGLLLGGGVAAVVLAATSVALSGGVDLAGPPLFLVGAGAGAVLLTLLAALIPASRLLRDRTP
ncbi:ABC transporter permease [Streptomyces kanamyceticus]|uniref:ABC transporter permease n=1 Tax=Streptomyces kanamyceticus TaxID=1967 RepID=A0A5J6GAS8_STRKN|nr:FtsX-like permease family protein [Streptomyces kanamyceticus]QEU90366.1 ABC transporter permease [Streptomyces kanamyceticus]